MDEIFCIVLAVALIAGLIFFIGLVGYKIGADNPSGAGRFKAVCESRGGASVNYNEICIHDGKVIMRRK